MFLNKDSQWENLSRKMAGNYFRFHKSMKKNSLKRQEKSMKRNQNLDKESHISILYANIIHLPL
jgi:hypothetical protein